MKLFITRLVSLILILSTFCTAFASCNGDENTGESASESANETSASNETEPIIDPEGIMTIFANGAYNAKFIRAENTDTFEKDVYNKVRDLFKKRTSQQPSIDTDFVAANTEKYNGPAVLIGNTNYTESQTAYNKLNYGESSITFSGNKLVLAFTTQDSVNQLLDKVKSYLNTKASKTEIKVNSEWTTTIKIQYHTSGNETFDSAGLISSAELPGNLGTRHNAGRGSYVYIKSGATKDTFNSACQSVEANGFKKYTTNSIGENLFATYVTQTQIVHFMYFPNKGELRTAVDKRGTGTSGFTVPGLSGDNKYTMTEDSLMTLVDIENSSWPGGMCLIFKLCDGRFVIVDSGIGGRDNDGSSSGWVYATLAKHASDPKNIQVAAWIFTHIHSDHIGGLVDMARGTYNTTLKKDGEQKRTHNVMPRNVKDYIKIDTIICNQSDMDTSGYKNWPNEIINAFKVKNVVKAHPGQVFYFGNCKFTIYGSLDMLVEESISNHNDESLSMMFEFNGKKLLVLGDAYPKNTKALATIYKENLKADIIQVSHHGYDNTDAGQVYQYVQATMVLWPVAGYEKDSNNLVNAKVNAIFKDIPSNMQFTPRGNNIDFDANWKKVASYSVMSAIPYCDCNNCKNGTAIKSSGN